MFLVIFLSLDFPLSVVGSYGVSISFCPMRALQTYIGVVSGEVLFSLGMCLFGEIDVVMVGDGSFGKLMSSGCNVGVAFSISSLAKPGVG
jgi:hypothetical protein